MMSFRSKKNDMFHPKYVVKVEFTIFIQLGQLSNYETAVSTMNFSQNFMVFLMFSKHTMKKI